MDGNKYPQSLSRYIYNIHKTYSKYFTNLVFNPLDSSFHLAQAVLTALEGLGPVGHHVTYQTPPGHLGLSPVHQTLVPNLDFNITS
jgi:hypothetical protein